MPRRAFPDVPTYLGGIEASLRRFAHYDYWADRVMPSILESTGADGLMYGMSERSVLELASNLKHGKTGAAGLRGRARHGIYGARRGRAGVRRGRVPVL